MVKGRITVTKEGKRHVHKDGKLDLTTDNTSKGTCCCCKPYTLASFTASDYATWNLSKYQGDGVAAPNRYWRLTNNYTSYPNSTSTTTYKYTWYFYLEIGCRDGNIIRYPTGTESASLYNCE